jgi:kinetochor protein Mis14/NSL1
MLNSMLTNPSSTYQAQSIEEHEPFSSRLWEKAKEAARQEEDLIEEIAALRSKMPGVAVENFRDAWKVEDDERVLREVVEGVKAEDMEELGVGGMGVGTLERGESVEGAWNGAVKGLERLKGSLPECVAKVERAGRAERYVLEKEKR